MAGQFGRNVKLIAQLAYIGNPQCVDRSSANSDFFTFAVPKAPVADIICRDSLKELAGIGPDHANHRQRGGNVPQRNTAVCGHVLFDPLRIVQSEGRSANQ